MFIQIKNEVIESRRAYSMEYQDEDSSGKTPKTFKKVNIFYGDSKK